MNGELSIMSTAQQGLAEAVRDGRAESDDRRNAFVALMAEFGGEAGLPTAKAMDAFVSPGKAVGEADDLTDIAHPPLVASHAIAEGAAPRPHRAPQPTTLPAVAPMVGTDAGFPSEGHVLRQTAPMPLDADAAVRAPAHGRDAASADAAVIVGDGSGDDRRAAPVADAGGKAPPRINVQQAQQPLAVVRDHGRSLMADGIAAEDRQPATSEAHRSAGVRGSRTTASMTHLRGDLITTHKTPEITQATAPGRESAAVNPVAQAPAPGPRTGSTGLAGASAGLRSARPHLLDGEPAAAAERMQPAGPSTTRTGQPADARSRLVAPAQSPAREAAVRHAAGSSGTASAHTVSTGDAQFAEGSAGHDAMVRGPGRAAPAHPQVARQATAEEMTLTATDRPPASPTEQSVRETRPEAGRPVQAVMHERRQSIVGHSESAAAKTHRMTADTMGDSQIRSAETVRVSPIGAEFGGVQRATVNSDGPARTEPVVSIRNSARVTHATLTAERPQYLALNIDPPELGRCELELSLHDGRIRATIIAERPETALTLRAVEGQVREQLAARNLQIAEFEVRAGTGSASNPEAGQDMGGGHRRQSQRWSPPAQPRTTQLSAQSDSARASMHDGTIDLMA